jgi:hypothetical protein
LLLNAYHENIDHPNWRRPLASLSKRFWRERMSFDCKNHCSNCVVCNRAKPNRQGSASLSPLGVPQYPWENLGMDFVNDLPKSSKLQYTALLILVCYLKNMAQIIPCHKEITAEETT